MDKISIIVCAHKQDPCTRNSGIYKAVQVGKALHPELDLGYLCDNSGENISEKNPNWCELTGLYWAWKNLPKSEYVGLCHYRRYFDLDITAENIDSLMRGIDLLTIDNGTMLSKRERAQNLMMMTSQEDFYLFADIFLTKHPECKKGFADYFFNSRRSFPFQMFVMKWELFEEYCQFMFPVLFEFERVAKEHGYTRQKRTTGYIGEWFLGLFVYCKMLKTKQIPLFKTDDSVHSFSLKYRVSRKLQQFLFDLIGLVSRRKTDVSVPPSVQVGLRADGIELHSLK